MNLRPAASAVACLTVCLTFSLLLNQRIAPEPHAQAAEIGHFSSTLTPPADREPEVYQGSFFYTNAPDALAAQGVKLYPEDVVTTFPDLKLGIGGEIKVYRAQPVVIKDGNEEILHRTWEKSVSAVLEEKGIEVGEKDVVTPSEEGLLPLDGKVFAITVTRVAETTVTVRQSIPFTTEYKDDPELLKGKTEVEQEGKKGVREKAYLARRENGKEVGLRLISDKVAEEPVSKIVRRGTKVVVTVLETGKASWYGGVPAMTAAHKTLPKGTMVRVVNLSNGKTVDVKINDRGPYVEGRVIDLSSDAYAQLAPLGSGVINVRIERIEN